MGDGPLWVSQTTTGIAGTVGPERTVGNSASTAASTTIASEPESPIRQRPTAMRPPRPRLRSSANIVVRCGRRVEGDRVPVGRWLSTLLPTAIDNELQRGNDRSKNDPNHNSSSMLVGWPILVVFRWLGKRAENVLVRDEVGNRKSPLLDRPCTQAGSVVGRSMRYATTPWNGTCFV